MRIISWNTNGLRATARQGNLAPLFERYAPDFLCLQEVKAALADLPADVSAVPGYDFFLDVPAERKGYSGVGTYASEEPARVQYGIGVPELDAEGRTVVLYYEHPLRLALVNCYFPNGGGAPERLEYKLRFYDAFLAFMDRLRAEGWSVILCGDLNVAHTERDLARPKENSDHIGFLPVERAWVDRVLAAGYVDVFRALHPNATDAYTYWDQKTRARERNVGWRIDYFIVSPELLDAVRSCEHLTGYEGSDHCPVMLDLQLE